MVGWLKTATELFGGRSAPPPQPLRYHCDCGESLRIERTEKTQQRSCPGCGTRFLVLPVSPFPIPRPPKGYVPRTPVGPQSTDGFTDIPAESNGGSAAGKSKGTAVATKAKSADSVEVADDSELSAISLTQRVSLRQRIRRQFTPLRMSIAGAFLLISVSGYLYWSRTQTEQARQDYTSSVVRAFDALDKGDTSVAAQQFAIASRAATILKLDDARSSQIHQYHREMHLPEKLSIKTFTGLLEELGPLLEMPAEDESPKYEQYSGGDWFLLDVYGKVVAEEGQSWLLVDAPVAQLDEPFQVRIPLPENAVTDRPTNALSEQRFVLATRCDRLAPTAEIPLRWILHCEETFLWENIETLQDIGLYDDDAEFQKEMEELLKTQARSTSAATAASTTSEEEG